MKKLLILMIMIVGVGFAWGEWHFPEKYTGPKTPVTDTAWHPDILDGYEARAVNQGEQFDGPCKYTIVRKLCPKGSRNSYPVYNTQHTLTNLCSV